MRRAILLTICVLCFLAFIGTETYCLLYQLDNPDKTQTRVFFDVGYVQLFGFIPGIAGAVIFSNLQEQDEDS